MTRKIRVLVIDDSALVRKTITDTLQMDPDIEVVGVANDPLIAMDKIPKLHPDVLTLDMEMPRMDGLTFLRQLKQENSPLPVVVISSLTQQGSKLALDAMEAGAKEVLAKPDGSSSIGALAGKLAFHIKAAARARRDLAPLPTTKLQPSLPSRPRAPCVTSCLPCQPICRPLPSCSTSRPTFPRPWPNASTASVPWRCGKQPTMIHCCRASA